MFKFVSSRFRPGGLRGLLSRLHRDERGVEAVEKVLIIAAIVLPLLGILIFFRKALQRWMERKWEDIAGRSAEGDTDLPDPDL
jgi:Flp pilus assembly pilin Flp